MTETQNKSSVANKLVDMAMENMYCKIIACFQNFFSRNTLFSFAFVYFCLQKAHYFFSILSFLFAKLYFLLQYFNYLANIYMALF